LHFKFNTTLDEGNFRVKIVNGLDYFTKLEKAILYVSKDEITSERFE